MSVWSFVLKGFVLGKPIQHGSYKEAVIHKLEKKGKLVTTRKRDGWKIYVLFTNKGIKFYTAGCNEITDRRLDYLKPELKRIRAHMSRQLLMLIGEVVLKDDGDDDITKAQEFFQCNEKAALAKQKQHEKPCLVIFGALFREGKHIYSEPFELFLSHIQRALKTTSRKSRYVSCVEVVKESFTQAKKMVLKNNWEGLVLYNADFENDFRLDGKNPTRPSGCYKWKPVFEDDFFTREVIINASDSARAKEVVLLQIDPITGKEFSCGKFGKFTVAVREELARMKQFPIVLQVQFESRFKKTGKLRNAKKLLRIRTDKKWEDCLAPKSYGAA
ncbi:MAG: hypothetical protein HYT93_04515 [Parcubacteria group bacterium]|nr:hypothetical protein [Parcubacteria group bacterium]